MTVHYISVGGKAKIDHPSILDTTRVHTHTIQWSEHIMKALLLLTSAAAFRERADGTSDHRISTQEPHAWLIRGGSNWDHHFTDAVRVVGTGVVHAAGSALVAIAVGGGRDGGGLSGIFRGMGGGGGGGEGGREEGGEREGGRVKRAVKTMLESSIAMPCTGHT